MIKRFLDFINESQTVILDNGRGGNTFQTNKYGGKRSIAYLNAVIKSFIEKTYGPFGFRYPNDTNNYQHFDLEINGRVINTEYIAKMVNNYTIFKSVIRIFNLKDEESFYHFMMNNLNNIYHYNGDFFKRETLPILINTTRKGNRFELKSKEIFLNYANSNGIQITIQDPTLDEDIRGIDFKFLHNNKTFTVQVKPYTDYSISDDIISVTSSGSLSLDVDYLVLYSDDSYIILRNPKNNRIGIEGKTFKTDKSNILQII